MQIIALVRLTRLMSPYQLSSPSFCDGAIVALLTNISLQEEERILLSAWLVFVLQRLSVSDKLDFPLLTSIQV